MDDENEEVARFQGEGVSNKEIRGLAELVDKNRKRNRKRSPEENDFYEAKKRIKHKRMRTGTHTKRVANALWELTYEFGFEKGCKRLRLKRGLLSKMTGLRKEHVSRAKRELIEAQEINIVDGEIGFNEDVDLWEE